MKAEVFQGGKHYIQEYKQGKPLYSVKPLEMLILQVHGSLLYLILRYLRPLSSTTKPSGTS
jgi:hypothetical protein